MNDIPDVTMHDIPDVTMNDIPDVTMHDIPDVTMHETSVSSCMTPRSHYTRHPDVNSRDAGMSYFYTYNSQEINLFLQSTASAPQWLRFRGWPLQESQWTEGFR